MELMTLTSCNALINRRLHHLDAAVDMSSRSYTSTVAPMNWFTIFHIIPERLSEVRLALYY